MQVHLYRQNWEITQKLKYNNLATRKYIHTELRYKHGGKGRNTPDVKRESKNSEHYPSNKSVQCFHLRTNLCVQAGKS